MARTYLNGFQCAGDNAGNSVGTVDGIAFLGGVGAVTWDSSIKRTGAYSLKVVTPATTTTYLNGATGYFPAGGYSRFYVRFTSLPNSQAGFFGPAAYSQGVSLWINSDGTVAYYYSSTLVGTSTIALTDTSRWYRIEVRAAVGTDVAVLRIDGSDQVTGSPTSVYTLAPIFGNRGSSYAAYTAYFADMAHDDSDWVGESHVILMLPTSDGSNTGWTAGAGGTSDLFEAVNNTPPGGVASASETDTTNIECASKVSNGIVLNFPTYTSAGIADDDVIKTLLLIMIGGEDITTGTKTLYCYTNNFAGVAIDSSDVDGGAHDAYSSASSLWLRFSNIRPLVIPAAVTKGTAPTCSITKSDYTSRTACVCFVGVYVEYLDYSDGPTVSLNTDNSPADGGTISDTTPTLTFRGTDPQAQQVEYQIEVDSVSTFDSALKVKYLDLYMYRTVNASYTVTVEIVSGSIDGTVLGTSAARDETDLPTGSPAWFRFTFASEITLSANTNYYWRITRSSRSSIYYSYVCGCQSLGASGAYQRENLVWSDSGQVQRDWRIYNASSELIASQENWGRGSNATYYLYGGSASSGESFQACGQVFTVSSFSLVHATSTDHTGFSGGTSHPYTSGSAADYTVQTALTP